MPRKPSGQLIVRARTRDTSYGVRIPYAGRRHYVTLGHASGGMNELRALEEVENILADVRRGIWRPPAPDPVPVEAVEEPSFHVLASEWVERRRHEVDARTVEHWTWALSTHLLAFFADYRPSQITVAVVERFKTAKLAEREQRLTAIERWRKADPTKRGRMPVRPLSNASINKCLKVLAQVLDDAVELGYVESNVARGKRRRLKAAKPKRTWLELAEVRALLKAAGKHRALLATMILAGLRVGELSGLRWRDVDLVAGTLRVQDAKTDAGDRVVDLSPMLRDELMEHAAASDYGSQDLVFGTSNGTERNRSNVTRQILQPAIERANVALEAEGRNPVEGATNHSLRRTFCALLYEAGATPAYVMAQMGHTDASLALEVYSKVMERKRDTGARMDALVRGADWAPTGTSGAGEVGPLSSEATESPVSGAS
jgi:integrase